jgi:translation initiation factor IF-1
MSIEDAIRLDAEIIEILGGQLFRAKFSNGHTLHAHCGVRDRERADALKLGETVRLEMTPFDMSKGRILFQERQNS